MTLVLELHDKEAAALKAKAKAQGISAEEFASQVLARELQTANAQPFWKSFTETMHSLPAEVFESLPVDGASEHDHYLYGSPKRNQP
jgi:hypothetical protein